MIQLIFALVLLAATIGSLFLETSLIELETKQYALARVTLGMSHLSTASNIDSDIDGWSPGITLWDQKGSVIGASPKTKPGERSYQEGTTFEIPFYLTGPKGTVAAPRVDMLSVRGSRSPLLPHSRSGGPSH
jgi:hypothetical protein